MYRGTVVLPRYIQCTRYSWLVNPEPRLDTRHACPADIPDEALPPRSTLVGAELSRRCVASDGDKKHSCHSAAWVCREVSQAPRKGIQCRACRPQMTCAQWRVWLVVLWLGHRPVKCSLSKAHVRFCEGCSRSTAQRKPCPRARRLWSWTQSCR